jgi:hypothetical protein
MPEPDCAWFGETKIWALGAALCDTRPSELAGAVVICFDERQEAIVAVSIFHIGLPLDHPSIPIEERPKLTKRLSDLQERMRRAGYNYEITHASPETGLDGFKHQLRTQPCDGVLIGGGVAGDPAMSYFMEQIVDVTHEVAPKAKIMFYNHSADVRAIVERWFRPRVGSLMSGR